MAVFLSDAWLAEPHEPVAPLLAAAGIATSIQRIVTKAPGGEVRYGTVVAADGTITSVVGDLPEPVVTLTDTHPNAVRLLRGELSPNAGFMSGVTKVAGHTGRLLEVLALAQGPAYEAARADLAARTEV